MLDLNHKAIWITGASSGIGAALARILSERGARLILSARREEQLADVKASCHNTDRHIVLPLDLAATETHADVVAQALQQCGAIDILVHNGGISQRALVKDTDLSVDRKIMEVNFFGTVSLTKAVLPSMLERKSGHFVVISSLAGIWNAAAFIYAASKHALHGFFESFEAEIWEAGLRVTMVCPGFVQTEISTKALRGDGSAHGVVDPALKKGMPAEQCAAEIVKAIEKQKPELLVGGSEKFGNLLKRLSPGLFRRLIRRVRVT